MSRNKEVTRTKGKTGAQTEEIRPNGSKHTSSNPSSNLNYDRVRPLTEFHLFPRLPTELRLKVYKYVSLVPRIVSLAFKQNKERLALFGPTYKDPEIVHRRVIACPRSRVPPLMHVHHESRQESMQVYTKVIISNSGPWRGDYIFVNHRVDTLHMGGDNVCLSAIRNLLDVTSGHIMPRLSVDISGSEPFCCTFGYGLGSSHSTILLYRLLGSYCTREGRTCDQVNSLEDLSFVVGSHITHLKPEAVSHNSSFHPAVTNGVSDGEMSCKLTLEGCISQIRKGLISQHSLFHGVTLPSIKFVSFAPITEDNDRRVVEIVTAQAAAIQWLYLKRRTFFDLGSVSRLERQHRCEIIIPKKTPWYTEKAEIAIKGAQEDIEDCRESLRSLLVDLQGTEWQNRCFHPPSMLEIFWTICREVSMALFLTLLWQLGILHAIPHYCVNEP
ncbi:hypothetical protein ONS96_014787 [Cadophora gregata f. sp. sojae]|nr:hypothetical protein ONS96_014787 [Cadophora gregata f. sp. sojae]